MKTRYQSLIVSLLTLMLGVSPAAADQDYNVDRNVTYGMYSGLGLMMDVYYPAEPNGLGIVFISGSGWTRELSLDAQLLTQTGQEEVHVFPLVESGYTVFKINHRAAPRFRHPAALEDAQRAVRYIRHNAADFGIAPDRIGGVGGSSGAHLISMLATMDGDGDQDDPSPVNRASAKLQCIVVRATPTDLRGNPEAPLFGFRGNAAREGSLEAHLLAKASPITYVTPDDPPFLFIHGDADTVVPFERSVEMQAALHEADIEAELIRIPGGGHGPRFESTVIIDGERVRRAPENAPDYIKAMIDWFDERLITD